jgi:hypothetical protein
MFGQQAICCLRLDIANLAERWYMIKVWSRKKRIPCPSRFVGTNGIARESKNGKNENTRDGNAIRDERERNLTWKELGLCPHALLERTALR